MSLPQIQTWAQGAFPWRGNPGSSYDTWQWSYGVQTSSTPTYWNAFNGNQLPNFSVIVPKFDNPSIQLNRPWLTQKNPQRETNLQTAGSGQTTQVFPQQGIANYISRLGSLFSTGKGGGSLIQQEGLQHIPSIQPLWGQIEWVPGGYQ